MKLIELKLNNDLTLSLTNQVNVPSGNYNSIMVKLDTNNNTEISGLNLMGTFKRLESLTTYESEIEDITIGSQEYKNSCYLPIDVIKESGIIYIGLYGYKETNNKIEKRLVFNPITLEITGGSFNDKAGETQVPDITKYEEFVVNVAKVKAEAIEDFDEYYEEKKATLKGDKGDKGDKGEKGDTGSIKFIIVENLPTTNIDTTAIYLKPTGNTENAYDEYIYVNNAWELLGQTQVEVDLTDYVKNTDFATGGKGGVIKVDNNGVYLDSDGVIQCGYYGTSEYNNLGNTLFISKGTLENVITGKGLVSNTDYATNSKGGVIKNAYNNGFFATNEGYPCARLFTYTEYSNASDYAFIGKGALENVLTERIGTIETSLQSLDTGTGVE